MDLSFDNIKTELKELDKDGNAETLKGEVAFQNRDALKSIANSANGVTRSNTKWRRCEYVIIGIRENEPVEKDLALKGWKALAYSHGDQTLILQNLDKTWTLYNSKCEVVGGNLELEKLIKKIKAMHNLKSSSDNKTMYQQTIYYGAPGTGKSNEIKRLTGDGTFSKNLTFRTTFHPDSDYSSFVGAYKPIWKDDKIVYDFRPQTFLKAYVAAWTHPTKEVALVIEEINRGNCAQVFGDIFQLLDREKNGLSKYPIEADLDMKDFLKRAFNDEVKEPWIGTFSEENRDEIDEYYITHYSNAFEKIKNGEILALPKNLSLLATMNTSDQSLFPMDSAFKRRWDWSYQPIVDEHKGWKIKIGEKYELIDWGKFLERINKVIADLTTSEDKQLGYYFCMPDEKEVPADTELKVISAKTFVGKVIFYLWNDVFKDYAFDASCCKDENEKEVLFAKFYNEDGKSVNIDVLKHFFETLKDDTQESLVKTKSADTDSAVSNGETIEESEKQDTTTAEE